MNTDIQKEIVAGTFATVGVIAPIIITYFLSKRKKAKEKEKKPYPVKLKYHPVFVRINTYKSYILTGFSLENKGKQEVFKNLLLNKLRIRHEILFEIAEEIEKCTNQCELDSEDDCNKLYNFNMEYLRRGNDLHNSYYKTSEYTPEEQKVLETVLRKFNKWHEYRTKYLEESLPLICSSKFYPDCHTKQAVIFDLYLGSIADMIGDAEKTLNEINGDLKGMVFRGHVI